MPGTIREENGKVYIDGVPRFTYEIEKDSFIQALRTVAHSLGREVPYHVLKGFSATAFRLMFHEDWHRYTPDATRGFDHTPLAFEALGYQFSSREIALTDQKSIEELRTTVIRSIKAGYPVMAIRLMQWEDWGVIVGYMNDNEKFICRTPHDRSDDFSENIHWPWLILVISGEKEIPDRKVSLSKSLYAAVELFETEKFGHYYSGRAAYKYWIAGLKQQEIYDHLEEERRNMSYNHWVADIRRMAYSDDYNDSGPCAHEYLERAHVNAWRYVSLFDSRREAAKYLKEVSSLIDGESAINLVEAGKLYGEVYELLIEGKQLVPSEWDLERNNWTQDKRNSQVRVLEQTLVLEERAIKCIKDILGKLTLLDPITL
jgi:hypothetical protein